MVVVRLFSDINSFHYNRKSSNLEIARSLKSKSNITQSSLMVEVIGDNTNLIKSVLGNPIEISQELLL